MWERILNAGWAVLGGVLGGCVSAALTAVYLWRIHVPLRYVDQGALFFSVGASLGALIGAYVGRKAGIWLFLTVPLGFLVGNCAALLVFLTLRSLQEHSP